MYSLLIDWKLKVISSKIYKPMSTGLLMAQKLDHRESTTHNLEHVTPSLQAMLTLHYDRVNIYID